MADAFASEAAMETEMRQNTMAPTTASVIALMLATPSVAQDDVEVLSAWSYDPLYADGWSVENMFDETQVIDANGEEIGDVENVIFSNEGEVLGIIAQVGGFWDIGDTHVLVPWDEVSMEMGLQRVAVPVTEETVDDYDVFGDGWFDEEIISEPDTEATQPVDDDLVAGPGIFKATDLIGDYGYLADGTRYGYISDIIVQDGAVSAIVADAGTYGRRGYYAYPYAYRGNMTGSRYEMPYEPAQVDTIENFDYERLQSWVP